MNFYSRLCTAICISALISGCRFRTSDDVEGYNKLRRIWVALENYESTEGRLPARNANAWRFSNTTQFNSVTWRGLLIERLTNVLYNDTSRPQFEVEGIINTLGKEFFFIKGNLVYSNLPNIESALSQSPEFLLVALTLETPELSAWDIEEHDDISSIVRGETQMKIPKNNLYILFANGEIGSCRFDDRIQLLKLLTFEKARQVKQSDLGVMGIRILGPANH